MPFSAKKPPPLTIVASTCRNPAQSSAPPCAAMTFANSSFISLLPHAILACRDLDDEPGLADASLCPLVVRAEPRQIDVRPAVADGTQPPVSMYWYGYG